VRADSLKFVAAMVDLPHSQDQKPHKNTLTHFVRLYIFLLWTLHYTGLFMTTPTKFRRWTNPITIHYSYTFINSASHIFGTRRTTQRTDAIILFLIQY